MFRRLVFAIILLGVAVIPVTADTLLMDTIGTAGQSGPSRGLNMETVETRFGSPAEIRDWVGNPPITRWVYDDFTVYFESDIVIHTVARRP